MKWTTEANAPERFKTCRACGRVFLPWRDGKQRAIHINRPSTNGELPRTSRACEDEQNWVL